MAEEKKLTEGNARHSYEYLKLINSAKTVVERERLLQKWGALPPLNMLLALNFSDTVKLDLPEGMPPYKRDENTHPDMFAPLGSQINRLRACVSGNDIRKMDKERVFIQVLENVAPQEGDVLVACKDKALTEMFPKVTKELVGKVFPNYIL